jgi:predicted lysophospholipase L1 biosynthesis ABC-type transport system permease subunit
MAERFWPGQDPVGRTVRFPDEPPRTATIIGVVADVKHNGLDDEPVPQIYAAQAQNFHIFATLVVRTEGDPMAMAAAVRGAVWSLDKDQPVWKVRTLESLFERSLGVRRFLTRLLSAYAGLALALAAVGLYGVVAYSVASRTREIGVRVALGAGRGEVLRLVLVRALLLAGAGVTIGLVGSAAADRALRSLLFEARASDPALLALVAFLLVSVALAAAWAPARRATRVDPLVALRTE